MQLNQKRNTVSLFYELERSCALIIHRVGGYIIEAYKLEAIPYKFLEKAYDCRRPRYRDADARTGVSMGVQRPGFRRRFLNFNLNITVRTQYSALASRTVLMISKLQHQQILLLN